MNHDNLAPGRFYGQPLGARQVRGLTLTEYRYAAGQVVPRHAHRLAYFCMVLRGSYNERYDARTRSCAQNMLIFHPEGEVHSDQFHGEGGHLFSIETDSSWLERVREHAPVLDRPTELAVPPAQRLGLRLFQEFTAPDACSALVIEALTLEILSLSRRAIFQAERWHPRWLRQAEDYLRAHFTEEVGLETLAAEVGGHPSHFARTFRAVYRCTAGEYVRRLRIEHACQQLRRTEIELADIAAETGFADPSHFSRTFRRHTGQTPSEFRQSLPLPARLS